MTTVLFRNLGEMFLDSNGKQIAGGSLAYLQAGTNNLAPTYADSLQSTLNPNPIPLNSSGRIAVPVYLGGDTNYKEVLQDPFGVTVDPWPFDNIPGATGAPPPLTGFERLFLPWVQITSASSPVTLAQSAAGNGYETDASSGAVVYNLPSASTASLAGTGYFFKRVDGSTNSVTVVPNGSDNIDGINAAIIVPAGFNGVYIVSDGAQWLTYSFYSPAARLAGARQALTASGATLTINMNLGWHVSLTLSANVTSVVVQNWPVSGSLGKLLLEISSTGAFTMTGWPGSTLWAGGTAPIITSGSGKKDTLMLTSVDGGSNFRGYIVAQAMA